MKNYHKYTEKDGGITDGGTQWLSNNDIAKWSKDTAFIEVGSEPADWQNMNVVGGELVRASAEQIAEREATAAAAYNERQRALRQAEYRAITDPQVIELLADATPEIAALKAQIREKHPYK